MMDFNNKREYDLYKDIQIRCGGEIYIGVVGPVRTGKSTFIKRFMDLMVLPNMEDGYEKERVTDEHTVKRVGEPPHLPRAAPEIEPGGEIVAVGYAAGSLGDALEREERIPRDEPAAADREQQQNTAIAKTSGK